MNLQKLRAIQSDIYFIQQALKNIEQRVAVALLAASTDADHIAEARHALERSLQSPLTAQSTTHTSESKSATQGTPE